MSLIWLGSNIFLYVTYVSNITSRHILLYFRTLWNIPLLFTSSKKKVNLQMLSANETRLNIHEDNSNIHEENSKVYEENWNIHEENLNIHEDNLNIHEENAIIHEENAIIHEENAIIHESLNFHDAQSPWVLLNLHQSGYYRVNYDQELWESLVHVLVHEHEVSGRGLNDVIPTTHMTSFVCLFVYFLWFVFVSLTSV